MTDIAVFTRQATVFARRNWGLLLVLLLALAVALWFAARMVLDFLYFHDPANADVDLKPWMTPRFIVQTYDLPRDLVFETLGLDPKEDLGVRLGRIARDRGISMEKLTSMIREEATVYRADAGAGTGSE